MTLLADMPDGLALRLLVVGVLLLVALIVNAVMAPGTAEQFTDWRKWQ